MEKQIEMLRYMAGTKAVLAGRSAAKGTVYIASSVEVAASIVGAGTVHATLPGLILQKQAAVGMLCLLLLCTSPLDTSAAGQPPNQPPSPAP